MRGATTGRGLLAVALMFAAGILGGPRPVAPRPSRRLLQPPALGGYTRRPAWTNASYRRAATKARRVAANRRAHRG